MTDFTPGPIITRENPLWDGDRPSWLRDDAWIEWETESSSAICRQRLIAPIAWANVTAIRLDASDIVYQCLAWNEAHPDEAPWFPWYGGDAAPTDWDENGVLIHDDGVYEMRCGYRFNWASKPENGYGVKLARIIGYRKRRPTTRLPGRAEEDGQPVGEWRDISGSPTPALKGYRRTPKYYPAIGETILFSGPNCDDENGFTWIEVNVVWADDIFIVTKKDGCWPTVTKHDLALCKPIPRTPLDIAKAEYPEIPAEKIERIAAIVKGEAK